MEDVQIFKVFGKPALEVSGGDDLVWDYWAAYDTVVGEVVAYGLDKREVLRKLRRLEAVKS